MSTARVVYRMYDANCRLLYVGRSGDLLNRLSAHMQTKPWWHEVDTITVEHCESPQAARDIEAEAIRSEGAIHNVQHNPSARNKPGRWGRHNERKAAASAAAWAEHKRIYGGDAEVPA